MSYTVYRVSYTGAPRNHKGIFVESKADKSGQLFHVTGNIQQGMRYETKSARRPEDSATFHSKARLGVVQFADFEGIDIALENIPPPKKQYDGPKRINPKEPLRRCQEWTT